MPKTILVDSSFLYAIDNHADGAHERAITFIENMMDSPLIPDIILAEVCFLFRRDFVHHRIADFLKKVVASKVQITGIDALDINRAAHIMERYADARLGFVDCCIVALAERLQITAICTFDRRDFAIIVPSHTPHFELLP
jgi:hypothetical protein